MKQLFLFLMFLFSFNLSAQIIQGIVSDGNENLAFVNLKIKNSTIGAITDSLGHFEFKKLDPGLYEIEIQAIGYQTKTIKIDLKKNEFLTIRLQAEDLKLDDVVISGTMTELSKSESPVPVEVYSKNFFKTNPNPSILESLQQVNGVRPQLNCNVCNTGDIHINGLEGPYTMVLIDGMPVVSGLSTVYGLTGIPQAMIERVEIVKGPASTLYGSEAVGGLINIITKSPQQSPKVFIENFSSDWLDWNSNLGLTYKIGKKIKALAGINYFNYQVPKDNNQDGFTDLTLQHRISVFNKWQILRKSEKIFQLAARFLMEDRWGGQMEWNKSFRGGDSIYGESIYTKRWELFGTYQLPVKEDLTFQFSANHHAQNSSYGTTFYQASQLVLFAQFLWKKNIGRNQFLTGTSFRSTQYDDNTPATSQISTQHLPGIFVQDQIKINEKNTILAGLRYDYNFIHGHVLSPRINYKWNTENLRNILRFSTGNGYRVAHVFTEDHAALTGARTVVFENQLKPETSWNVNLNFVKKIHVGKENKKTFIGLDASIFYTYFSNRILPDYSDANRIIYKNLNGFSVSQGISLNIDLVLTNGLKCLAGFTWMDVTYSDQGIKKRQLLTERFSGNWTLSYTIPKWFITIDYTGNLYGPMILPLLGPLDNRPEKSPIWSLQNIQMSKKIKKTWEVFAGVKNFLNFTPPANSIARAFDPFDKQVSFDSSGQVIPTANNPNALTFDPSYVFAPNQGIRFFAGFRFTWN